ncbi:MAG TPA: sensor histidine kinase KdpD [Polyangiaceae bacterium]|nr:sensor histidine kinase KdpD [Polyangiaceae bacterium]
MARSAEIERPDPDVLLKRVVAEESTKQRGKLTVFFGAAPGVGKTYTMLEVARAEMEREKRDVVVGVVETHGRYETGALTLGLELLPRRKVNYKGVVLEEFDIDAALARHPDVILVDELAHTNAEGSRHPKRWQDVEELLDAGIDVFSTLNVQHVESLNDVIAKITGVVVRETVPDSILEEAHAIKLVDLPPEDLLERLREGKVYVSAQAQRAIENFFRKGNLIALRELALRHTAERVDAQMLAYRKAQGIEQTWATTEQILVAVSPSPYSARLARAARRMAAALHARWYAVYVEPVSARPLPKAAQARLSQNLRLAEQLGAEVVTLSGENLGQALIHFAREHNVTKMIVGKPLVVRPWDKLRGSLVDRMARESGDIDLYVTAGDPADGEAAPEQTPREPLHVPSYLLALTSTGIATCVAWLLFGRSELADVVMTYLLGVVLVSSRVGLWPSVLAALSSVAAFDLVFIPPYFTLAVADLRHAVTFAVMFLVAVVISGLTQRVRNQAAAWQERERRTSTLYALSRELSGARDEEQVVHVAADHLERVFESSIEIFAPKGAPTLTRLHASHGLGVPAERDVSMAQWVWSHRQEAGLGTATLPGGEALYVPLVTSGEIVGVLGLRPRDKGRFSALEQRRQVDAFAAQLAMALERAELAEETERARREVEAEQLRSSLLSSVSHDLRTPLAVITGAAGTLLDKPSEIPEGTRRDLIQTILDEAERLNRLIRNLLDMTRLESGAVTLKRELLPLEEIVGAALNRLETRLAGHEVRVELPPDLPLVPCDPMLVEQALINLLENAVKYGKDPLELSATRYPDEVMIEVADRGAGIPAAEAERIFEKFHRGGREGSPGGVGLGLAICRAIATAHGGRIRADQRDGGGAAFRLYLPLNPRGSLAPSRSVERSANA